MRLKQCWVNNNFSTSIVIKRHTMGKNILGNHKNNNDYDDDIGMKQVSAPNANFTRWQQWQNAFNANAEWKWASDMFNLKYERIFLFRKKSKIIFILLFCSVLWFSFISLHGKNSNAIANVNLMLLYIWHYWKMLCACGYFANETIELNFVMHCTVPSVTVKCCYHFKDSFLMEMSSKLSLFFLFYRKLNQAVKYFPST